jgi:hypothetical protein
VSLLELIIPHIHSDSYINQNYCHYNLQNFIANLPDLLRFVPHRSLNLHFQEGSYIKPEVIHKFHFLLGCLGFFELAFIHSAQGFFAIF